MKERAGFETGDGGDRRRQGGDKEPSPVSACLLLSPNRPPVAGQVAALF